MEANANNMVAKASNMEANARKIETNSRKIGANIRNKAERRVRCMIQLVSMIVNNVILMTVLCSKKLITGGKRTGQESNKTDG